MSQRFQPCLPTDLTYTCRVTRAAPIATPDRRITRFSGTNLNLIDALATFLHEP